MHSQYVVRGDQPIPQSSELRPCTKAQKLRLIPMQWRLSIIERRVPSGVLSTKTIAATRSLFCGGCSGAVVEAKDGLEQTGLLS